MRGTKTKREVLVLVLLAVWCFLALVTEGASGAASRGMEDGEEALQQPHIVLIVADDLGWYDVPWHNEVVYAPNLESLAREGVILERSYVQPLCTPSRSALLSGRYPFTIGRQFAVIFPEQPAGLDLSLTLLPQALKAVGYETHIVGKWHLGFCSWAYTPTERGFDTFYGFYTMEEDYYHHTAETIYDVEGQDSKEKPHPDHGLACTLPSDVGDKNVYIDMRNNTTPEKNQYGVYSTYVFAEQVEQLLATREPEVPMFLYLPFQSVHTPLQVPDLYKTPYAQITDEDRKTFLGMVTAMDEAVGRVVTSLKDTGHYNNTVIVFTTDNGAIDCGGKNWPLRGNKTTMWEGGTRGVAFIHSPILPNAGTTNPALIHITDWLPTLVGLAGGEVPDGIDGVDQWEALTGLAPSARTNMVYNIDNETEFNAGIRMGKYKLLVGNPGPGEWTLPPEGIGEATHDDDFNDDKEEDKKERRDEKDEEIVMVSDFTGAVYRFLKEMTGRNDSEIQLYDLESDPEERSNVASAHPGVVDVMVQMLYSQMSRYTPADYPDYEPESNPSNFGGVWSPGWC